MKYRATDKLTHKLVIHAVGKLEPAKRSSNRINHDLT